MNDKGYTIYPALIPTEMCDAVIKDIMDHVRDLPPSPETFGMVEMYHYQSMWDIRQYPPVWKAFNNHVKRGNLWVSIDRICYKQPTQSDSTQYSAEGFIHWDIDINQYPRPPLFQGLVALADADETMGGFQCVPELYRGLDEWLGQHPVGKITNPNLAQIGERAYETTYSAGKTHAINDGWPIEKVPLQAGDLLIWDSFLPHGNALNRGSKPRFAMYITMFPEEDEYRRRCRIHQWLHNLPPSSYTFPGDPRKIEQKKKPAALTWVGQKLLGLELWDLAPWDSELRDSL